MDIFEVIEKRRSIRKYKNTPIPHEKLMKVLNAARLAPSAKNYQPWKFIIVNDNEIKQKLVVACRGQKFIAEAPVVIVACGLESQTWKGLGGNRYSLDVDVAIAVDHLTLAACAEGLGTCWIGAFNEDEVKKILEVPKDVRIVALIPLGYPDEEKTTYTRKSIDEIISYNKWE
jgi:nitroreductase